MRQIDREPEAVPITEGLNRHHYSAHRPPAKAGSHAGANWGHHTVQRRKTSDDVAPRVYPKCSRAAGSAGKIYRNGLTFTQQKAMSDVVGAPEQSHNFASGVNPTRNGESSAWDIDSRKLVPAQEKTMSTGTVVVFSHDIAASVDPEGSGEASARNIN